MGRNKYCIDNSELSAIWRYLVCILSRQATSSQLEGSRQTVLVEDQGTPDACKGLNFGVPSKSKPRDTISIQTQFMEKEDRTRNFSDCEIFMKRLHINLSLITHYMV